MNSTYQLKHLLYLVLISMILVSCSKSGGTKSTKPSSSVTVSTFAGSGSAAATNGTGPAASFSFPSDIASIGNGILYIGDFGNSLIRTININSVAVSTFAGTGTAGFLNGTAAAAQFNGTAHIVFDKAGDLFVADEENNAIREVTVAGNVITVAGTGTAGYQDGAAATATFNGPDGMVIDANGNLYVADCHNYVIRKIDLSAGTVSTYAGTGAQGFANGPIASAVFDEPYGMALDASGNMYVTDILNNSIRKITVATGMVSTYAGTGAQGLTNGPASAATFYYPLGCTFDSDGNLYVCDTYNNVIREISASGNVTTLAGTGTAGLTDGAATTATFNFPIGILVYGDGIYVADTHNNVIRKITL